MSDVLYLGLTALFFALALGVLKGVDRVWSSENLIGSCVSLLLLCYLLAALLFPERF